MADGTCSIDGCNRSHYARSLCQICYNRLLRHGVLKPLPRLSLEERFWAKVNKTDTCWLWTAGMNSSGYGQFNVPSLQRPLVSHKFAYELIIGPVPPGMYLDHICHNPPCVNPEHLRVVTPKENVENRLGSRCDSSSGVRGVDWKPKQRLWRARVTHNRVVWTSYFKTLEEASEAARLKRLEFFTHNDADRR